MSTEKVKQYKEDKKNRKQILKKQKIQKIVARVLIAIVCLALAGWIFWSGYSYLTKDRKGTDAENVHTAPLDDYLETLQQTTPTP